MDIYEAFRTRPITFIKIDKEVIGNVKGEQFPTEAVWKVRRGYQKNSDQQQLLGDATIYIVPTDPFVVSVMSEPEKEKREIDGHLCEVDGVLYRIFATSEAFDYELDVISHYKLNVEKQEVTKEWADGYILE